MNATLVKALVALVPVSVLVAWSGVTFARRKTLFSCLQFVGAGCLVVVALTHVCEALHLLLWMRFGEPDSVGHYLDVSSAVLGVTLLPAGYFLHRRQMRNTA